MPTATWPMPDQQSSEERSAWSARRHRAPGEAERRHEEPAALIEHGLLDDVVGA
jgi:hypothetical protein